MNHQPRPLCLAISLIVGATFNCSAAIAQEADSEEKSGATTLAPVSVIAIGENENRIAAPFSILTSEELQQGPGTLGDALNGLPGVNADTFGGGASRPVIRGQVAPRVKVLSDSSSVLDASDISPDHAVTADPLLSERIEVLRGPATLLYGGGAIGGVVNVLDNKIANELPQNGLEGRLVARGNTVANEKAFAGALTGQVGSHLVWHAEASSRDAQNYEAPHWNERTVDGTWAKSRNAAAGLSWVTPKGYVGLAYSYRDDSYGLPGHSHEYEGCHPHGSTLHCGGHDGHDHDHDYDHDHDHEDGHDAPTIALKSKRVDLRGEYRDPIPGISRVRFRASHTNYHHNELDEGTVTTTFANKGAEGRIELEHTPLGDWAGVFGLQHADTRFSTQGVEAFLPKVDTRSTGLFLVEHYEPSAQWHFELGARHEWIEHKPGSDTRARPVFKGNASSLAGAAIWEFQPGTSLTFSAARSARLPHAQELYARGVHLATNTYECGLLPNATTCGGAINDAPFGKESSKNFELTLRKTTGPFTFSLGSFINNIDHFIYARTLDRHEDFRLIKYTQRDAKFRGFEGELAYQFNTVWTAKVFADRVRATFSDGGGNVPRIPAARLGTRLSANWPSFSGEIELYRVAQQNDIADYESTSAAYNMLNLTLNYRLADARTKVFLRGSNLFNEQIWNHASFLASTIPLPGRNLSLGMSYDF